MSSRWRAELYEYYGKNERRAYSFKGGEITIAHGRTRRELMVLIDGCERGSASSLSEYMGISDGMESNGNKTIL
jgi:hypothetical protein